MSGDLHHIDDLFRSGLEGKEEKPDDKVWTSVEQELDKNSFIAIRKKYARLRQVSAILLILLLGVTIFALRTSFTFNLENNSEQKALPAQQKSTDANKADKKSSGITVEIKSTKDKADGLNGNKNTEAASGSIDNKKSESNASGVIENKNVDPVAPELNPNKNTNPATTELSSNKSSNPATTELPSNKNSNPAATELTRNRNAESTASDLTRNNNVGSTTSGIARNKSVRSTTSGITRKADAGNELNGNKNAISTRNNKSKAGANSLSADNAATPGSDNLITAPAELATVDLSITGLSIFSVDQSKISAENELSKMTSSSNSQASIPVKNKKHQPFYLTRFSITPTASINFISNSISENSSHYPTTGNTADDIKRTEEEKLSYTYSLLFDVKVAPRITIQSGLGYMFKTTYIEPKEISAVKVNDKIKYQFDCSAGRYYLNPKYGTWPRVGDNAYTIASANELEYLTVPIAVKYYFGNNKLNFYALAGGDANIFLKQNLTTGLYGASYYGKKTSTEPIGLNKVYMNAMIGGGIYYSFNRRIALNLAPAFRFALNPINKDMPFNAYPKSFSLAGGVRVSF